MLNLWNLQASVDYVQCFVPCLLAILDFDVLLLCGYSNLPPFYIMVLFKISFLVRYFEHLNIRQTDIEKLGLMFD